MDQRVPTNAEILAKLGELDDGQRELRSELREHRSYVDLQFVTRESLKTSLAEMYEDFTHRVPGMLEPLMREAMVSAVQEERHNAQTLGQQQFREWYTEQVKADRDARKERAVAVANALKTVLVYLLPLFTIVNILLHWIGWT